jgi:hypothetical protein
MTGGKANQLVEWMNRVPMYLYLRDKKGFSAEAASAVVRRLQLDYADLAPAEREVFRRLFPFWTFTKKMTSHVIREMFERPGGPLATAVKQTGRLHDPRALIPDYVAGGTSIPLAPGPRGEDRYLGGIGMFYEDPFSFLTTTLRGGPLATGFSTLRGAGLETLSRLTPPVKALGEWTTGQTFFQRGPTGGRPLHELYKSGSALFSRIAGRPVNLPDWMEVGLANLPTSRIQSTAMQLSQLFPEGKLPPRKTLSQVLPNVLTGLRITDVPKHIQDALLREEGEEIMRAELGAKTFAKTYIPKDVLATMSPSQRLQAEKWNAVMRILARRATKRAS